MVSFQNLHNEEEESETNTGDTEDENLIQVQIARYSLLMTIDDLVAI